MRGIIPTQWRQWLGSFNRRRVFRAGVIAVALIAGWGVDRLCRPRLHIASGALEVAPDADSEGRATEVLRSRLDEFLTAQRARLAGDGFLVPAVTGLNGGDRQAAGGMVDTLRDRLCVETAMADDAPRGTIFITVAWPEGAAGPGDDRDQRAAATCYRLARNLLTACVVEHTKLRRDRERESPVARMMRAAREDADEARKALDEFLAGLPAEQRTAIAGGGLAGMQNLLVDASIRIRRLDEQLNGNRALIRAVERELAEAGKDPAYRVRVPPAAEAAVAAASKAVAACESKITTLTAANGGTDKALAEARAELAAHRRALVAALQRHLAVLKETGGQLGARQAEAIAALKADRQRLLLAAGAVVRYRMLRDDYESARDALRAARAAEPQARRDQQRDRVGFEVRLFRDPVPPDAAHPYRPITWFSALAGLATFVVPAAAWMLVVERRLLNAPAPAARGGVSDAEVLATIPRVRGGEVVRTE